MTNIGQYFNHVQPMSDEELSRYRTGMTAVSLFAGVGGFDLALERNGVKVVAAAEIDKHASKVLAQRFPNSQLFDDVRKVNANELRTAGFIPERGIITGGFPCQDLSVAGKRLGFTGQRSSLFYEIARIADETKAEWLVLENVPGLLSSQRGADMGAVIGTLVELGYGVAWRTLDAQHFGVPQRRRRVFIVARRSGDPASSVKVLFERQSVRGDTSQGRASGQETTKGAGHGAAEPTLYEPHHGDGRATEGVANTLAARMGTGGNNTPVLVEPEVFIKSKRAQNDQDDETWKQDAPHPTLNQFDQGDSRTVTAVIESPSVVRRLTPLECERLQGFPDGWTEGQADSHRYKQMGNAVAVPVVEWIIRNLVEVQNR